MSDDTFVWVVHAYTNYATYIFAIFHDDDELLARRYAMDHYMQPKVTRVPLASDLEGLL